MTAPTPFDTVQMALQYARMISPTKEATRIYDAGIAALGQLRQKGMNRPEVPWFINETPHDPALPEFITRAKFSWFSDGGQDRSGRHLIFLRDGEHTVAAIRSKSQNLHARALGILRNQEKKL
jgi:hypothetical protein